MATRAKPQSHIKTEPKDMLKSKVTVENFPSRPELYELLNKFIQSKNYNKDYTTDNKDNVVIFTFKNPVFIFY